MNGGPETRNGEMEKIASQESEKKKIEEFKETRESGLMYENIGKSCIKNPEKAFKLLKEFSDFNAKIKELQAKLGKKEESREETENEINNLKKQVDQVAMELGVDINTINQQVSEEVEKYFGK